MERRGTTGFLYDKPNLNNAFITFAMQHEPNLFLDN